MQQLQTMHSASASLGGTDGLAMVSSLSDAHAKSDEYSSLNRVLELLFPSSIYLQHMQHLVGHVHSLRLLTLSNGAQLMLKSSPPSSTAVLRRERSFLDTEARFLALLGQSANPCIPHLYHYNPHGGLLGSAFLIRQHVKGTALSEMKDLLDVQQRSGIDRHLGFLTSVIGQNVAPGFGSLQEVAMGAGKPSWRHAFSSLFEGALRDAEDMFINLPYAEIRLELVRLASALDEVTLPRLVIVDFGRPSHVLLDTESKQLSGLVDFSDAFWGDVLMAAIFDDPSPAVLEGAGMPLCRTKMERIRLLLYSCYRSVCQITVQYYRSRDEAAEFDARRRLTATIAEMAAETPR